MQFTAKAKYVRISPYKLRPYVDVIRGKNVKYALDWLGTIPVRRTVSIIKVLESAAANAKSLNNFEKVTLVIKDIRVDQGPIFKYFKPGAMGRANIQRKRLSHISIVLESKEV